MSFLKTATTNVKDLEYLYKELLDISVISRNKIITNLDINQFTINELNKLLDNKHEHMKLKLPWYTLSKQLTEQAVEYLQNEEHLFIFIDAYIYLHYAPIFSIWDIDNFEPISNVYTNVENIKDNLRDESIYYFRPITRVFNKESELIKKFKPIETNDNLLSLLEEKDFTLFKQSTMLVKPIYPSNFQRWKEKFYVDNNNKYDPNKKDYIPVFVYKYSTTLKFNYQNESYINNKDLKLNIKTKKGTLIYNLNDRIHELYNYIINDNNNNTKIVDEINNEFMLDKSLPPIYYIFQDAFDDLKGTEGNKNFNISSKLFSHSTKIIDNCDYYQYLEIIKNDKTQIVPLFKRLEKD